MTQTIEQLQAKVAELERAEATLIKAGYTNCGGELWKPPLGKSAFPLLDRIAELEEENARLKTESRDASLGLNDYYGRKLAAEQLNNKLLREALIATRDDLELRMRLTEDDSLNISNSVLGQMLDAIDIPASTEALDAYVAEKLKDVQLQDIEQYRLQMAGISTAAIGYWKEDDSIHPDYDTPALRDVAKLYANYESRTRQCDLAVEALEKANEGIKAEFSDNWTCNIYHPKLFAGEKAIDEALSAIKESEAK